MGLILRTFALSEQPGKQTERRRQMSSEIIPSLHPYDEDEGGYTYVKNFTVTVKERQEGQPCFLVIEEHRDVGLRERTLAFNMPFGSDFRDARNVARELNNLNVELRLF